jgi:hypothetical protein
MIFQPEKRYRQLKMNQASIAKVSKKTRQRVRAMELETRRECAGARTQGSPA